MKTKNTYDDQVNEFKLSYGLDQINEFCYMMHKQMNLFFEKHSEIPENGFIMLMFISLFNSFLIQQQDYLSKELKLDFIEAIRNMSAAITNDDDIFKTIQ